MSPRKNDGAEKKISSRNTAKKDTAQKKPRTTDAKKTVVKKSTRQQQNKRQTVARVNKPKKTKTPIRIIPLGGLNGIGKNITAFECANDIFIVDCGLAFPDDDMPGVDLVIPDFSYLEKNVDKIRGIAITHGHEDHIGALPYLLKTVNVPIYASKLAIGLIEGKLKEHGMLSKATLNVVKSRQTVKMGCMAVEFIRVNHSIPDAMGLAIHTPAGIIIHTGDFKIDYSPIEGEMIDLARLGELGNRGVLALMSDSTNSERPGSTMSESKVGESFERLMDRAGKKRVIIATFSSNIHRIQQIVDLAVRRDRKIAISGRSMLNVVSIAMELGYLSVPDGLLIDIDLINKYPPEKIIIITTGSQGEPMSALARMSVGDHRKVSVGAGDFIIISATPIPGNEKLVSRVVNELLKLGADVVYESMYEVHVSGHACQDEQKLVIGLVKPKFFIPVHGEYKHLKKHAATAETMGIPEKNIVIAATGNVIETDGDSIKITGNVPAGHVLVDGLGVGDVGSIVLRDRKHLAQDGLIIVAVTVESGSGSILSGPDIISRGFVYVRESEELIVEAQKVAQRSLERFDLSSVRDIGAVKMRIKDDLYDFVYMKTKRTPMILPIIMTV